MKIRDIFAVPFLFAGLLCESIAIKIGGQWTAKLLFAKYLSDAKKGRKLRKK